MRIKAVVPVAAALSLAVPLAGYAAAERGAATRRIVIEDFAFKPKKKVVTRGSRVTWRNRDSAPHNAVATKKIAGKPAFKTRTGRKGAVLRARAPKKAGRYTYICTVHPQMKGTLVVR